MAPRFLDPCSSFGRLESFFSRDRELVGLRGRPLALHGLTFDAPRASSGPRRMDFEAWAVPGSPSRPPCVER